jgi:hypothetical protein
MVMVLEMLRFGKGGTIRITVLLEEIVERHRSVKRMSRAEIRFCSLHFRQETLVYIFPCISKTTEETLVFIPLHLKTTRSRFVHIHGLLGGREALESLERASQMNR